MQRHQAACREAPFEQGASPVKTTFRHLYILLAAASNLLLYTPEAQALGQQFDLIIRVANATGQTIEFCDRDQGNCKTIDPGDTYQDAGTTEGHQLNSFYQRLYGTAIKICGKSTPLSRVITPPVSEKDYSDIIFYRMSITEENYQRVCHDEKTKDPLNRAVPSKSH